MSAGLALPALAQAGAQATLAAPLRPELQELLPQGRQIGSGRLRAYGFQVYDATLWAESGLRADNFASQSLALELSYLRGFKGQDIAERSIGEIKRAAPLSAELADKWTAALRALMPDVKKGDRIMGLYQPGVGVSFWKNGKPLGEIRDAEFAMRFFGIWLGAGTSQPGLRSALLAGAGA